MSVKKLMYDFLLVINSIHVSVMCDPI